MHSLICEELEKEDASQPELSYRFAMRAAYGS